MISNWFKNASAGILKRADSEKSSQEPSNHEIIDADGNHSDSEQIPHDQIIQQLLQNAKQSPEELTVCVSDLMNLAMTGPIPKIPQLTETQLAFQSPDFKVVPSVSNAVVRNVPSILALIQLLEETDSPDAAEALSHVLHLEPVNYFMLEEAKSGILLDWCQRFPQLPRHLESFVLDLVQWLIEFGYNPFKELLCLCLWIRPEEASADKILDMCKRISTSTPSCIPSLRDVGLPALLADLLKQRVNADTLGLLAKLIHLDLDTAKVVQVRCGEQLETIWDNVSQHQDIQSAAIDLLGEFVLSQALPMSRLFKLGKREDPRIQACSYETFSKILDKTTAIQDEFRETGGFINVVSSYGATTNYSPEDVDRLQKAILSALASAMRHHKINQTFFREQVGYSTIELSIRESGSSRRRETIISIVDIYFSIMTDLPTSTPIPLDTARIRNVDPIRSFFAFVSNVKSLEASWQTELFCDVLARFEHLLRNSAWNQVVLSESVLPSRLIDFWTQAHTEHNDKAMEAAAQLAARLIVAGSHDANLTRMLNALLDVNAPSAMRLAVGRLLVHGVSHGRLPPRIRFHENQMDSITFSGFSSFPLLPTNGWSLCFWWQWKPTQTPILDVLRINGKGGPILTVQFTPESRYLHVSIPGKTGEVVFATSIEPHQWTHVTLVHTRSKIAQFQLLNSTIVLYINGIPSQQAKWSYPTTTVDGTECKVVLGGGERAVWDLGPMYMFDGNLDDASIFTIYNLGPHYRGTFADSLKTYQTFEIITPTNLEFVNRERASNPTLGPLSLASCEIKVSGSVVTEDRVLFAIVPANGLTINVSPPFNHRISVTLPKSRNAEGDPVQIITEGKPLVIKPHRVVDGIWCMGSCPLLLVCLERSQNVQEFENMLSLLVESIRFNWRTTADMELHHLYETLALILKSKPQFITAKVVNDLLLLVGKREDDQSIVANALAYRHLFMEFEIWRNVDHSVQELTLKQFKDFLVDSKFHVFNNKRCARLLLIKRLLMAFHTRAIAQPNLNLITDIFKPQLQLTMSPEILRSVATYLMLTLSGSQGLIMNPEETSPLSFQNSSELDNSKDLVYTLVHPHNVDTSVSMRNVVLEILSDSVSDLSSEANARLFADSVTTRWLLLFLDPKLHPTSAYESFKMLLHLLLTQSPDFLTRFKSTQGVSLLISLIPPRWRHLHMQALIVHLLVGKRVATLPSPLDLSQMERICQIPLTSRAFPEAVLLLTGNMKYLMDAVAGGLVDGETVKQLFVIYTKLFQRCSSSSAILEVLRSVEAIEDFAHIVFRACNPDVAEQTPDQELMETNLKRDKSLNLIDMSLTLEEDESSSRDLSSVADAVVKLLSRIAVESLFVSAITPVPTTSVLQAILNSCPPSTLQHRQRYEARVLEETIAVFLTLDPKKLDDRLSGIQIVDAGNLLLGFLVDKFFDDPEHVPAEKTLSVLDHMVSVCPIDKMQAEQQSMFLNLHNRLVGRRFYKGGAQIPAHELGQALSDLFDRQQLVFHPANTNKDIFKALIWALWQMSKNPTNPLRTPACVGWKLLLLQRPAEMVSIFRAGLPENQVEEYVKGFSKVLDQDSSSFTNWVDANVLEISGLFARELLDRLGDIVAVEGDKLTDRISSQIARREARLQRMAQKVQAQKSLISKYNKKTAEWLASVQGSERRRIKRYMQDYADAEEMVETEWRQIVYDNPLLPKQEVLNQRLDFIEGPWRMRRRLRPNTQDVGLDGIKDPLAWGSQESMAALPIVDSGDEISDDGSEVERVTTPRGDASPERLSRVPTPSILAVEELDSALQDDLEDKNRKLARLLDPGDEVLETYNVARVLGLDVCEGLLLLCKSNIYVVDNYIKRLNGELDDVHTVSESERSIYNVILNKQSAVTAVEHTSRQWAYDNIKEVHKRKFLFRNSGLEVFLQDGRNFFLTMEPLDRDLVYEQLLSRATKASSSRMSNTAMPEEQSLALRLQSLMLGGGGLQELTTKWERWEISNFEYLMQLNSLAGRSYNDLTQYPVFPWVLADYESEEVDLSNPASFRDLSKPMGAQTEARANIFRERFEAWEDPDGKTPAFHYGTHYSSAMIVCSFLIRLEPFTRLYLNLQGGTLDHADRLFHSIPVAWSSSSKLNTTDVRELIPEFYYFPEFLNNINRYDFGSMQTGERIGDVVLPPWAKGDARLFIKIMRQALECDYVSERLHQWIDLIFGYKQQGEEASKALNVFHHLSYDGSVDIDAIQDPDEKTTTIGIINNFGQTPRQLFKRSHVQRQARPPNYQLPVDGKFLIPSAAVLKQLRQPVISLGFGPAEKILLAGPLHRAASKIHYMEWRPEDSSLRLRSNDGKLLSTFEVMRVGRITSAVFVDDYTLITGGTDNLVNVLELKSKNRELTLLRSLRGHTAPITMLAASRAYGIIVSGAKGDVILWDLNRLERVKTIKIEGEIRAMSINDTTGDFCVVTGLTCQCFTVNGVLFASGILSPHAGDPVTTIQFFTTPLDWSNDVIVAGYAQGSIKIWTIVKDLTPTRKLEWKLQHWTTLSHPDTRQLCSVLVSKNKRFLVQGDANGQVRTWTFPDGSGTEVQYEVSDKCRICQTKVNLMRGKNCIACGAMVCFNHWTEASKLCSACIVLTKSL